MTDRVSKPLVSVLLFGGYDSTKVSRIEAIRQGLSRHGFDVTECNSPLEFAHVERVGMLRRPWLAIPFAAALAKCWTRLIGFTRRLPTPDVVLVPYPAQFDVLLARALFPGCLVVADLMVFLDDTVHDRRGMAFVARAAGLVDSLAMRVADILVLDTEENQALVPIRYRRKCVVVPVGATDAWFIDRNRMLGLTEQEPPGIVFFGLFTPLQGTDVIAAALGKLASRGIAFTATIIGSGQDASSFDDKTSSIPVVHRIRWLDGPSLRTEVHRHDICLGIFGTTPKALRVVPQKLALGAASGCALVTSDTSPQRRLLDGAAAFVRPGDPDHLADELERLLRDRPALRALRAAAVGVAEARFTPQAIVSPLVTHIRGAT